MLISSSIEALNTLGWGCVCPNSSYFLPMSIRIEVQSVIMLIVCVGWYSEFIMLQGDYDSLCAL